MKMQGLIDSPILALPKVVAKAFFPNTFARMRDKRDKAVKVQRRASEALWNNQLYEILKKIVSATGVSVLAGPFRGMMFWPVGRPGFRAGGEAGSLLGLYELELHDTIAEIVARSYNTVIDIGCAEGYYAVGLAYRMPQARVFAFDIEANERQLCQGMAFVNGVAGRVEVGSECTVASLRQLPRGKCLVFSDCEGAELDLLRPDMVPELVTCDLLVELHDCFIPGLSDALLPRFAETHRIEIIHAKQRDPDTFPELCFLSREEIQIALDERRPSGMTWAMMWSRTGPNRED
jgi:hypothetical protein